MTHKAKASSAANRDGSGFLAAVLGRNADATRAPSLRATGSGAPSRRGARLATGLLACALVLLVAAPGAMANLTRAQTEAFGDDGTLSSRFHRGPHQLGFDQGSDRLYTYFTASTAANFNEKRIAAFDAPAHSPSGGNFPVVLSGISGIITGSPNPRPDVAIDNGAGASAGNIYAVGQIDGTRNGSSRIFGFDSTGAPLGGKFPINPEPIFPVGGDDKYAVLCGAAVHSSGDIYVSDLLGVPNNDGIIRTYDSAGNPLATIDVSGVGVGGPCQLAFDSAGNLFVAMQKIVSGFLQPSAVFRLDAPGYTTATEIDPGPAVDVAVDSDNDRVYVTHASKVSAYEADGTFLYDFADRIPNAHFTATTVDEAADRVYVAEVGSVGTSGLGLVYTFGPAADYPDPALSDPVATDITATTATLNGTVNPDGNPVTECRFEYVTNAAWGSTRFTDLSSGGSVPCDQSPASIGSGTDPVAVSAFLSGLHQNSNFRVRLIAANANGALPSDVKTFGTLLVVGTAATNLTGTRATLNGFVNPEGQALSKCEFEYVTLAAFNSTGFTDLSSGGTAPCDPAHGSIPADNSDHPVSADISELAPQGTQYRFRLMAANATWDFSSSTAAFTTPNTVVTGGTDEVQTVTINGATGGNFTLSFKGKTTTPITFNPSSGTVNSQLTTDPSTIGPGDIRVQGPNGGPFTITFLNNLSGDQPQLVADGSGLTPTGASVVVETVQDGVTATALTANSATLNGTVNPDTDSITECRFEYVTEAAFQDLGFSDLSSGGSVPCDPAHGSITGTAPVDVHADVTGLAPGTAYRFRLTAGYAASATIANGDAKAFTTLGPIIRDTFAQGITTDQATLHAVVNPEGKSTVYRFEYGTEGPCSANPCAATPVPDALVASDSADHQVSDAIAGLQPGIVYHFRVVATNADATNAGPDLSFRTFAHIPERTDCANQAIREAQGSAYLASCRAYEQVTPPDKNFADADNVILSGKERLRANFSPDGDNVTFCSVALFGDPAGQMSGLCAPYILRRTAGAWQATNPFPNFCRFAPDGYFGGLGVRVSNDMSRAAVVKPESEGCPVPPLDPAAPFPEATGSGNTYLGDFSTDPPAYSLVAPLLGEDDAFAYPAGGTDDFSHLVFHSSADQVNLTPPGNNEPMRIYDYHQGTRTLISVRPEGDPFDLGASIASRSEGSPITNAVSRDGQRVYFNAPVHTPVKRTQGSDAPILMPDSCRTANCDVYLREGNSTTFNATASECTTDCGAPAPALPVWATPAGDKLFFQSCAKLTDDSSPRLDACVNPASSSSGIKLYRWDRNGDPGARLVDVSADRNPANGADSQPNVVTGIGLIGAGEDGDTAYFLARAQLVEGGPTHAQDKLYRWRDEPGGPTLDYLGALPPGDEPGTADNLHQVRVSAGGEHLLLHTRARLDPTLDRDSDRDAYLWSQASGWNCVSCQQAVVPSSGDVFLHQHFGWLAVVGNVNDFTGQHLQSGLQVRSMSEDGTRVVFATPDTLLPRDANTCEGPAAGAGATCDDVYEWRAPGTGACEVGGPDYFPRNGGCLALISSGRDADHGSVPIGISPDGATVFFFDRNKLVGHDVDSHVDIYAARTEGGFPEPEPAEAGCEGEGCREGGTVAPGSLGAGTAVFEGPGNGTRPSSCRPAAKRAGRLSRTATRLRKSAQRAGRAGRSKQAKRLHRKAARVARKGRAASKQAKRCRGANRRANR